MATTTTPIICGPATLPGLTQHEAIADALHRCLAGIDSNDNALFESACLKDEFKISFAESRTIPGWTATDDFFKQVSAITTTHIASNVRVMITHGGEWASLAANAVAYHIQPGKAFTERDTPYTAGCLYLMHLKWDKRDGLWKIVTWNIWVLWTTGDLPVLHEQS